ncbi:MAG TPA: PocR ligand-binding domain-containing protein [Clostridia bacterium]|nr:PocR ligand-binding domain-containing protein [Clostridia bacterium]HQC68841.1 PocR ligand-binding domain-containing protein [Clostridia bacterium]
MLQLNTANLYKVLQDFYTLTNIRIVIFDAEFRELLAYPREREHFCHMLRKTPEGEAGCYVSDKSGCLKCAKNRQPVIYKCHAGLTEAVAPIMDKDGVLAYVMFGQIILKENCEETRSNIKRRYPELAHEADNIPVKSQRELSAAATVLQAITAYVITNHWVVPNQSAFIREIDRYVEEHLSENITVRDICAAFRIGRTRLYELSADYLGCGLAEYIRRQRIIHAQRMLTVTDMSVTDIAFATGFADYNHFSRIFRQIAGMSAREYRKKQ